LPQGQVLFTRRNSFYKEKLFSQEFFTFKCQVTSLEKVKTLEQLVGLFAVFTLFLLLKVFQGPKKGHVILLMQSQHITSSKMFSARSPLMPSWRDINETMPSNSTLTTPTSPLQSFHLFLGLDPGAFGWLPHPLQDNLIHIYIYTFLPYLLSTLALLSSHST
jgi:hypothetical protein